MMNDCQIIECETMEGSGKDGETYEQLHKIMRYLATAVNNRGDWKEWMVAFAQQWYTVWTDKIINYRSLDNYLVKNGQFDAKAMATK